MVSQHPRHREEPPEYLIPEDARHLISRTLDSVVMLEILLLFYHQPEREWLEREVAEELRISYPRTQARLESLAHSGLLSRTDTWPPAYRYYPATMELNASVASLARSYAEHPENVGAFIEAKRSRSFWSLLEGFRFPRI